MRTDCKFYESRTYPNGETVRKCDLDLAPEAPWRCPADCPAFKRRADIAWQFGSLVHDEGADEPIGLDNGGAEVLDAAEDILNEIGPQILAEMAAEKERKAKRFKARGKGRKRKK